MVNFVWDQLDDIPFLHMDPVYGQWLVQGGLMLGNAIVSHDRSPL